MLFIPQFLLCLDCSSHLSEKKVHPRQLLVTWLLVSRGSLTPCIETPRQRSQGFWTLSFFLSPGAARQEVTYSDLMALSSVTTSAQPKQMAWMDGWMDDGLMGRWKMNGRSMGGWVDGYMVDGL